jgi:putative membrane protein (TIGR04086 family)
VGIIGKGGFSMAKSFEISQVSKGVFIAVICSFVLTLLLSVLYFFTDVQESLIHTLIIGGLSVLIGSFTIAFQSGSKGLIYGLAVGFGFFLFSIVIYYIFYEGNPTLKILLEKLLVSLVTGALGGTLGAILKK